MYGDQVNKYGKAKLKNNWLNFVMSDSSLKKFKNKHNKYSIVNTDVKSGPGKHYCALYINNNTFYIFDTYSNPNQLKTFINNIKKNKMKYKFSDLSDNEQVNYGKLKTACGALSLSWLLLVKEIGIKNAMKL